MLNRGLILFAACALFACASGPHPALKVASNDMDCDQGGMKVHEIYPKKVRVEGCGKQAIYVDACNGYGIDAKCGWGRYYETEFERAAAEQDKKDRKEAAALKAEEKRAESERAAQEKADQEAAEQEKAEQEKVAKAEEEKAKKDKAEEEKAEKADDKAEHAKAEPEEKGAAKKKAGEEPTEAADEDKSAKAADKKPEKAAKKKKGKKDEGIDAFLK